MTRPPRRFLLYCISAVIPAAGLLAVTAVGASAQTAAPAAAKPSASAEAATLAKAAIKQLAIGHSPMMDKKVDDGPGRVSGLTDVTSTNWSGYADTGSSFSKVSSSWTEPSASCTSGSEQLAAFWVGIDGYSSDSVEQDGTLIECYRGEAYQYTWWEMYPTNDIQTVGSTLAAGDKITSTVTRSGTSYTLTVTDATHTADSFSTTQTCSDCANSSAEWIAEAPSSGSSIYPLADFGSWTASSDSVTEGSSSGTISSFTDDQITMIDSSKKVKAQPGPLNSSGNSFSVAWERAS